MQLRFGTELKISSDIISDPIVRAFARKFSRVVGAFSVLAARRAVLA